MTGVVARARARTPWAQLLLLGGYGALAAVLTRGVWLSPQPSLVGGTADVVQASWFVGWMGYAIAHGLDPLVTTIMSPPGHPVPLMWNNAAPLLGVWLSPITLLFGAIPAYNVGIAASLALSAWSAALVAHRVTKRWAGAVVTGLIFGFSPWSIAQAVTGHLFLTSLGLVPILLWLLAATLIEPKHSPIRMGAALGLAAAGQLLVSQEILADTALVGALVVVAWLVAGPGRIASRATRGARVLAAAATAFGACAAVPLWIALAGPRPVGRLRFLNPFSYTGDLVGLVVPRRGLLLDPQVAARIAAHLPGYFGDATVYVGIPLLVAIGWVALRRWHDPWARSAILLFAVALLFTLGPRLTFDGRATGVPLPWTLLLHLPIFELLVPSRMAPLMYLGAGFLAALAVDALIPERRDVRWVWPLAAAAALVLPLLPAAPLPRWVFASPPYFLHRTVPLLAAGSVAAVFPPPQPLTGPDVMLWQMEANFRFRLPWGYAIQPGAGGRATAFGGAGPLTAALERVAAGNDPGVSPAQLVAMRDELHGWGVRTLILGPMAHRYAAARLLARLALAPPRWTGGVATWVFPPRSRDSAAR